MNIPENIFSTLTDEQKEKVNAAQSPEELLAIAKETGFEIPAEQLESIAGGNKWTGTFYECLCRACKQVWNSDNKPTSCPFCHSRDIVASEVHE